MRRGEAEREGRGIRSFIAVLLPEPLKARLDEAAEPLRQRGPAVSWVRAENLHVTLRFLGGVDEATIGKVREALAEAAVGLAPFRVVLRGFGGFPTARAPRVVWVGVADGSERLGALHARVEAALARQRIPAEGRPFHPHVTLGRAREPRGAAGLAESLGAPGAPLGETHVDAIHLMRSDLHPSGARYSVLAREPLRE
jgi:RNA 2',3'-cyclic 3'-phosphodiesterase